jgi:TetR/AcrR family transcriptional repressor of nem operon
MVKYYTLMKQGSNTRQNLLDTANELISASNYSSVSVDDICVKAGVNKGSFYHFFASKAELAVETLEDYWPQLAPLDRIMAFCDTVYKSQKEKMEKEGKVCGCPYGSLASEQSTLEEPIRQKATELFGRIIKYFEAALHDAVREKIIPECNVAVLASDIHALIEGILLQAKVQNDIEVIYQLKPAIFRFLGLKIPAVVD